MKIIKNVLFLTSLVLISYFLTNCEKSQDETDDTEQQSEESEGDDISDLIEFWSMMTSSIQNDQEHYNVFELSAELSEDGTVENFTFKGEEMVLNKDEEIISLRECTDSRGGKWTACKKFCRKCGIESTIWLKSTISDCQCACFETRTEYAADKSYTIYFRQCQL